MDAQTKRALIYIGDLFPVTVYYLEAVGWSLFLGGLSDSTGRTLLSFSWKKCTAGQRSLCVRNNPSINICGCFWSCSQTFPWFYPLTGSQKKKKKKKTLGLSRAVCHSFIHCDSNTAYYCPPRRSFAMKLLTSVKFLWQDLGCCGGTPPINPVPDKRVIIMNR